MQELNLSVTSDLSEDLLSQVLNTSTMNKLSSFSVLIKNIENANNTNIATLLKELIEAQDYVNRLLMVAIFKQTELNNLLDHQESIAFLENAASYFQKNNLKDTNEARKMYANIDDKVVSVKSKLQVIDAVVVFLKNQLSLLRQAHDDAKKIVFHENPTQWEGM